MNTTSFIDLLRRGKVARIEIPIIQRDYAQGRIQEDTVRIRTAFLGVLHTALTSGDRVHLDFVYGEIAGDRLVPLDGQQRLTALFLLHWYLAARAGVADDTANRLPALTYETRHSSRLFCGKLVEQRPFPLPDGLGLSDWIRDQSWFVSAWQHDPTIASMLVVLDDIHGLFAGANCPVAWQRLVDPERPAITFDFLPIENLGLTDDLYIKMNSRGKPLTRFENFKAGFEEFVRGVSEVRYKQLCEKVDNEWSDVLWKVRGSDDLIDDEFMRYFRFVTGTLGDWTHLDLQGNDLDRAKQVYGKDNPAHDTNIDVFFHALDDWHGKDVGSWFEGVFTGTARQSDKVALFDDVDLFRACSKSYGDSRAFPLWKVLVLFAVLAHLRKQTTDFPERVRTLRNLALNSQDEVRQQAMPELLEHTYQFVVGGPIEEIRGFNQRQLAEEMKKSDLLAAQPALAEPLRRLEDHALLRGCLAAFDLDAPHFEQRAAAFAEIFRGDGGVPVAEAKAALLACGDYSQRNRTGKFQFASESREVWRDLLTRNGSTDFPKTRAALQTLLDAAGAGPDGSIQDRLRGVVDRYLAEQQQARAFDWRYYLVRYAEMRTGDSGLYAGSNGEMGFSVCMLRKTQMNSYYRDPFLFAIFKRSGADMQKDVVDPWYSGAASDERWLELRSSGVQLRCVTGGFLVKAPTRESCESAFELIVAKYGVDADGLLAVPQETREGGLFDTDDRVELGGRLLADLCALQPG